MAAKHERLLQETFLLIQKTFPLARSFPRQVGVYRHLYSDGKVRIGMEGMGDAYILFPYKNSIHHIELEFKVGRDKLRESQKKFKIIIESMNGLYIEVRYPMDAINAINSKYPQGE